MALTSIKMLPARRKSPCTRPVPLEAHNMQHALRWSPQLEPRALAASCLHSATACGGRTVILCRPIAHDSAMQRGRAGARAPGCPLASSTAIGALTQSSVGWPQWLRVPFHALRVMWFRRTCAVLPHVNVQLQDLSDLSVRGV